MNKFETAIRLFDASNSEDPHKEVFEGKEYPKELLYSYRMSEWLNKIEPNASESLQLTARCQHINRWKIPRENYPMDRKGYHHWRTDLKKYHSDVAGVILREAGYDQEIINQVKSMLLKEKLKTNPEMQVLEDVVCLVFLNYYFSDFIKKHDEDKLVVIVERTWKKMSERGHQEALKLKFTPEEERIIKKAIGG